MAKPTGWVVDMRHYIDEDTGDLPEGYASTVDRSTIDRDALTQPPKTDRRRLRGSLGSPRRNDERSSVRGRDDRK